MVICEDYVILVVIENETLRHTFSDGTNTKMPSANHFTHPLELI